MRYKKLLMIPLSFALVVGISACSVGGEDENALEAFGVDASKVKKDSIASQASKTKFNEDENNENENNENEANNVDSENNDTSNVGTVEQESNIVGDSVSQVFPKDGFDGAKKNYTAQDLYLGTIYIETQEILGAKVFESKEEDRLTHDVIAAIEALDEKKVASAVKELEKKFPSEREKTNYNGLTDAEKVLYNTYVGLFQSEISQFDDFEILGVEAKLASIDENGDMVLPPGAVLARIDGKNKALYDTHFRMYKVGDEWHMDALDFISNYYLPPEDRV